MIPAGPFILEEDAFGGKVGATDGTGLSAVVDSSIKINFSESYGYVYFFNHQLIILCIVILGVGEFD